MTSKEFDEYIESISVRGSILGLDNEKKLLARLGNPEKKLKFVHIAGTNGKGSILAFTSSIIKAAGYKVGRYISPVICEYREKIQVNEKPISKAKLLEGMELMKSITDTMDVKPTIFEVETALAFWYFEKMNCDIVVLETGLGGRDDATNVIENTLVSAFASISMDHMAILGKTIEAIATVKAGIIKNTATVVTGKQKKEALKVLEKAAMDKGCKFVLAKQAEKVKYKLDKNSFEIDKEKYQITLNGTWQPENAAIAIGIINELNEKGFNIDNLAVKKGLLDTKWFGRFSVINKKPMIIVDGAHNEDASLRLRESIEIYLKDKELIYIMGVLADKEYEKLVKNTADLASQIITLTPANNPRALQAYDLAMTVRDYNSNVTAAGSIEEAVEMATLLYYDKLSKLPAGKDCVIIAFGSLSYLGRLNDIVLKNYSVNRGKKCLTKTR